MALRTNALLRQAYERFPRLQPLLREGYGLVTGRPPPHFTGWLMSTDHEHAWSGPEWGSFRDAQEELHTLDLPGVTERDLDGFRWRHWTIAYAVHHAATRLGSPFTAVECGVQHGMTAYITSRQLEVDTIDWTFHLFDAWAPMSADLLTGTEKRFAGGFADLEVDRTTRNLSPFAPHLEWHKGRLPESLVPIDRVDYLHVDINSSAPTIAVLDALWPRMPEGGVIVLDDYGWREYADTKHAVDDWLIGKPGTLFKSPTGQALYFR